ncbi:hypothetical protein FRC01_011456 [Tulasnella sp. 417]|nr:hypothetical protein FRC01_011456 [Tulasnella sp. 417]
MCACCPLLEVVDIGWIEDDHVDEEAIVASGPQMQLLPVLRVLNISWMHDRDGVVSSHILRTTNMPQLMELKVSFYNLGSAQAGGLLSPLSRRCPLLTTLEVMGRTLEWGHLGLFSGLQDLELRGELSSWTTEHLESIIENLPNLGRLSIRPPSFGDVDRSKSAFTLTTLEAIAKMSPLCQLQMPLNALEIPWVQEPPVPTAKFAMLVKLMLGPLHIEANSVEPFAKYLAQVCPTVNCFKPIPIHTQEAELEPHNRWLLTNEEEISQKMMRTLFFNAQRGG